MKIYITKGMHWAVPSVASHAYSGLGSAQQECAELVNILRSDMMDIIREPQAPWDEETLALARDILPLPLATADDWESTLRCIQVARAIETGACENDQEVNDMMTGLIDTADLECDVWIEEYEVLEDPAQAAPTVETDHMSEAEFVQWADGAAPRPITPPAILDLPEEDDPDSPDNDPTNIVAGGLELLDRVGWTICQGDVVRFLDAEAPGGPTIYRMTITKESN